jgi:hypothetical protein
MIFLLNSWVITGDIDKHEAIMRKLVPHYKKIKEIKSYRYFGHFVGQDLSPWGGRLEIFEFESLAALENFFKKFTKSKEATNLLNAAMDLSERSTIRFSIVSEMNRELWFERE